MSNVLRIFLLLGYVASLYGMKPTENDNEYFFFIYPKILAQNILKTPAAKMLSDELQGNDFQHDNRYQTLRNLLESGVQCDEFVQHLNKELDASYQEKKLLGVANILLFSFANGYRPGYYICQSLRDQINQEHDATVDQLARVIQAASHKVRVLMALDSVFLSVCEEHKIGPNFAVLSDPDYLCECALERLRKGRSPTRVQQSQQKNLSGSCP